MKEKNPVFLQIPQGTESFHLEEAKLHEILVSNLTDLFSRWGYLPSQTPVFDFYENYQSIMDKNHKEKIYRLIDRDGELLMLRSDITLFMAKQMSLVLKNEDLPVRVYYADTILRHEEKEDMSSNEFFQTGIELMGAEKEKGDIEVLILLSETLSTLPLPENIIHLGSRRIFNLVFAELDRFQQQKLLQYIGNREKTELQLFLTDLSFNRQKVSALMELFRFIGTTDEFDTVWQKIKNHFEDELADEIQYLIHLARSCNTIVEKEMVHLDFSEIGNQPYYTGIVFQVYSPSLESAMASGGRYDGLLNYFGLSPQISDSSVGFSLLLRKVENSLSEEEIRKLVKQKEVEVIKENSTYDTYAQALEMTRSGKTIRIKR